MCIPQDGGQFTIPVCKRRKRGTAKEQYPLCVIDSIYLSAAACAAKGFIYLPCPCAPAPAAPFWPVAAAPAP